MTTFASLDARLRKVERTPSHQAPAPHGTVIITENDEDEAQQLAALEAAGTYKPGWPLIAWRIVDPEPRSRHP